MRPPRATVAFYPTFLPSSPATITGTWEKKPLAAMDKTSSLTSIVSHKRLITSESSSRAEVKLGSRGLLRSNERSAHSHWPKWRCHGISFIVLSVPEQVRWVET